MNPTHDIILIGGGCSSMQWLKLFTDRNPDHNNRILIIERNYQPPARTWCFWTDQPHPFSNLVSHSWKKLRFASPWSDRAVDISPFTYQYIAGSDFFNQAQKMVSADKRVEQITAPVTGSFKKDDLTIVHTPKGIFSAPQVYSSVPDTGKLNGQTEALKNGLWQHFRGWYIKTEKPAFDPETATLMDFRTEQTNGAVFHYVLPFSETEALVECTVFGKATWLETDYDQRLNAYISTYLTPDFKVTRTEQGQIPMSQIDFSKLAYTGTTPIGTAAGQVKPSTGYMFLRSMNHIQDLLDGSETESEQRYQFYDALLLRILEHEPQRVARIMDRLFTRNRFEHVLRFLDEDTTLTEDVRMFSGLPYLPFLKQLPDYLLQAKS